MASVFGISALRSRFDDWRTSFWKTDAAELLPDPPERPEPKPDLKIVGEPIDLSALIERLVIPRLVAEELEHGTDASTRITPIAPAAATFPVSAADIDAFAELSVAGEAATLLDFIDECMARGSTVEHIYIDLLAPAARRLGVLWEEDRRDFVDVTMGLWRIQEVLRELARRAPPSGTGGTGRRSALFAPMPGDQHGFGSAMICECFQRAGWSAEALIEPTGSDLLGKLAGRHFDLVGLTLSNDCPTATVASLIRSIRSVSSNPGICVMIGGRLVNERSDLVARCGADGTAPDGLSAVEVGTALVSAKAEKSASLA